MAAVQLELPLPAPRPKARRAAWDYAVEVNECGIFASRIGIEFWTDLLRRPLGARLVWLFASPGGGVCQLPCADKEEAGFFCGQLIEHGIHETHARVKRARRAT